MNHQLANSRRSRRIGSITPIDRFIMSGSREINNSSDEELTTRRVRPRISNEISIEHEGSNRIVLSLQPSFIEQDNSEFSSSTTRIVLNIQDSNNTSELLGQVVDRLIDQWLDESQSSNHHQDIEDDFSDSILDEYDIDESSSDQDSIASTSTFDTWDEDISSDEDFSFHTCYRDKEGALLDHFYELFNNDSDVRYCYNQLKEFYNWSKNQELVHHVQYDNIQNQYYSSNGYTEDLMHRNDFIIGVSSQQPGTYLFMNDDILRQYMLKLGQSYRSYHSDSSLSKCKSLISCHDYFGDDYCSDNDYDSMDSIISLPTGSFTSYFKKIISFAHVPICKSWKRQRQELYDYIDDPDIDKSSPLCHFISSINTKDTPLWTNFPKMISRDEEFNINDGMIFENNPSYSKQHKHLYLYRALDMNLIRKHTRIVIEKLKNPLLSFNDPKDAINTSISLTLQSPQSSSTTLPFADHTTKMQQTKKPISHESLISCLLYTIQYYEYVYCMFESQLTLCELYLDGSLFTNSTKLNPVISHESSIILFGSIARHMRRISNQCIIIKQYIDILAQFMNEYLATGYAMNSRESRDHIPFSRYDTRTDSCYYNTLR